MPRREGNEYEQSKFIIFKTGCIAYYYLSDFKNNPSILDIINSKTQLKRRNISLGHVSS